MNQCVVFSIVHRNGEWHVLRGHASEPLGRFKDKADAIGRGRELAMGEDMANLRVALSDGSIQSEFCFGKDASEIEGVVPQGGSFQR